MHVCEAVLMSTLDVLSALGISDVNIINQTDIVIDDWWFMTATGLAAPAPSSSSSSSS